MAPLIATSTTHIPLFEIDDKVERRKSMWQRLSFSKVGQWLGREDGSPSPQTIQHEEPRQSLSRRLSKRIVPGLPRPATVKQQQSERREYLLPVQPRHVERRAFSTDRRRAVSSRRASSPHPLAISRVSAPEVSRVQHGIITYENEKDESLAPKEADFRELRKLEQPHLPPCLDGCSEAEARSDAPADDIVTTDLEDKWILNLSMHFRDRSNREKFFVTYAETPNRWRRVTVSCDYREAPPDSLERDLQELQYQRDKSARIYESIRESLPDIQFYDSVTNLKLQTKDGRLHVHVTEDVNEIIPYPSVSTVDHLACEQIRESDLEFDSHLSGFVYKVKVSSQLMIKKEIPGPDTVDEFLYEINALYALSDSESVIQFRGVIVDDKKEVVKGLLISLAEQGALVDLIYDMKGQLPWKSRERWAKQIIHGLAEIHEAGFVQGDFTLSNIVIDGQDNAKIIDINRRGCPVGWEPPEISRLIESSQRISMYIGVKSDLYQLGMALWALAQEEDEPERQERPLTLTSANGDIPQYYREVVALCLNHRPQQRPSATALLSLFPVLSDDPSRPIHEPRASFSNPSEKQYIDPKAAVEREDLARFRELRIAHGLDGVEGAYSTGDQTDIDPPDSSDLRFDSSGSYIVGRRGRQLPTNTLHLDTTLNRQCSANGSRNEDSDNETPQIIAISPSDERKWEEVNLDGHPYLIQRDSLELEDLNELNDSSHAVDRRTHSHTTLAPVALGPMTGDLAGVGGGVHLPDCGSHSAC
ncbi:MAG: hypothetical protein M1830_006339 [Pleopsidium flavum]|nr:MAG: hypothetical protein M1830_006339 [Pleopsidium flavum]